MPRKFLIPFVASDTCSSEFKTDKVSLFTRKIDISRMFSLSGRKLW